MTRAAGAVPARERATFVVIVLLLLVTPLIVIPDAKEAFRLGKALAAGWFGLLSLAVLAWSWRYRAGLTPGELWQRGAVRAVAPLTVVMLAGVVFTAHPLQFREAFADYAIAVACLTGWSIGLGDTTMRRVLAWTIPPATLVAALGLDQFIGMAGVLDWLPVDAPTARLRMTSTMGGPGDLACLLVLPMLVALDRLPAARGSRRVALFAALAVMLIATAVTGTLAAIAATAAGAAVWWVMRSEGTRVAAPATAVRAAAVILIVAAVSFAFPPVRERVVEKTAQLAGGDLNAVLTGRLDGWRAAAWMTRGDPVTGVGLGAYRAEFADAKLALLAQGTAFFEEQHQVMFATPHNEILSVAAEQGLPGLVALVWGLVVTVGAARRVRQREGRAFASAGLAALVVLSLLWFPLHLAAVAFPWVVFLAWLFRASEADA